MDNQQEMTPQKEQEEWTEKQKIGKENRTTALRSQKGGGHHGKIIGIFIFLNIFLLYSVLCLFYPTTEEKGKTIYMPCMK